MADDSETEKLLCDCSKCGNSEFCEQLNSECDPRCKCRKCHSGRFEGICKGTATVLSGRLEHLVRITCCACITIFAIIIFIFILQFFFFKHRFFYLNTKSPGQIIKNRLCKEITNENSSLFLMGYLDAATGLSKKYMEPTRNIFYVVKKPINKEAACNIESILQLLPDKLVYIIQFDKYSVESNDYITNLQKHYTNLNRIKTDEAHFFKGSLFENYWNSTSNELALFAAKSLAVWKFGGAAISENLLLNSRDIFDSIKSICFADRDIIYCPQECSAYIYQLMREILIQLKASKNVKIESIINSSINEFCSDYVSNIGCNRVYRLNKYDMCESNSGRCKFIRTDNIKRFKNDKNFLKRFCPFVMSCY